MNRQIANALVIVCITACSAGDADKPLLAGDSAAPGGAAPASAAPASPRPTDCKAAVPPTDRTICLPDRVGPITRATTRAELAQLFGAASLTDMDINVGEGYTEKGTMIRTGGDSIAVTWTDSTRTRISGFRQLSSAWRTSEGIGVGSTLDEVDRAMGGVKVLGFGWDYGGTIMLPESHPAFDMLYLRGDYAADDPEAQAAAQKIRGDNPYSPSDPDVKKLKVRIRSIDIIWRDAEQISR